MSGCIGERMDACVDKCVVRVLNFLSIWGKLKLRPQCNTVYVHHNALSEKDGT